FQAEDGIRDRNVTGVQTCALPICVNPYVNSAICDILFDEKISGSIHFTPGNAYEDADNGNRSTVHWDLVLIQTPEYGGGEIYFRSEERRVGKECRYQMETEELNKR